MGLVECRGVALSLFLVVLPYRAVAEDGVGSRPVAEILGKPVRLQDLDARTGPDGAKTSGGGDRDARQRQRGERLRTLVWQAVFEDYAQQRKIAPTAAEIESHVAHLREFQKQDRLRREQQRAELITELNSSSLSEARRRQAQSHLDTLDRLKAFEAQRDGELRDPAQAQIQQESERRVAEVWVRRWKIDQALHREFGGRIVFQQAGWEPIDAYRKLLEGSEAKRRFVVDDPTLRMAVYSYFHHSFVYADETKARFYFEKPYWERTEAELKAAGFK